MQHRSATDDPRCSLVRPDGCSSHCGYGTLHGAAAQVPRPSSTARDRNSTANVFSDGCTRIDFVLVWETVPCELSRQQHSPEAGAVQGGSAAIHSTWRKKFLDELHAAGIHMEKHVTHGGRKLVHYALLSAPWPLLCRSAEELRLRVPLQALPREGSGRSAPVPRRLRIPSPTAQELPDPPPDFYTCPFKASKLSCFLGSDEHDTFFSATQRHQILYEILSTTQYGPSREREVGLDRLLSQNVFSAAFPLHEGPCEPRPEELAAGSLSQRQVLFQYWASWSKWSKYQPLDHIRQYFGEKVAFYFAWLGFYTGWLLPAALLGMGVFITGVFLAFHDVPSQEICSSREQMCPLCKTCPYWQLSQACGMFMAGRLFDHGGTIFFSMFMSLWAVLFLEFWKRTSASLAHHWTCSELEDIEERPRPQFRATAPMTTLSPVTGLEEPHFPPRSRLRRSLAASLAVVMMIAVVLMFLVSGILYRAVVAVLLSSSRHLWFLAWPSRIASLTGSVLNLIFVLILSKIYISLAHFLTQWEMHRTQTEHEDAFTFKVFILQFVIFYSSPIYIAFFKGKFVGYPGHYLSFLGVRNEQCGSGGCFIELAQELLVVMVGKQMINNVQEVAVPKLKCWWHKHKLLSSKQASEEEGSALVKQPPWVMDHQLLAFEGLFDEYLEMVLQFGFITLFAAACPLAPLFALLNNCLEIRVDARKLVRDRRRPVAQRARGIGAWLRVLEATARLAAVSNALLIAFTSDTLPRLYYAYAQDHSLRGFVSFTLAPAPRDFVLQSNSTCRYRAFRDRDGNLTVTFWQLLAVRLGFIIVFEHVVLCASRGIAWLVPDVPEALQLKVKRERYLAKEALAENKVVLESRETRSKAGVLGLAAAGGWDSERFASS
ncbi:anoctamin-7 [Colius striatus]|uniref:anoctamin-7 n=1 Tax=Colius striatus TaxID=57412 RepID=UPI002B1DBCC8|nr:anoctamin-7 [Colius striatus]